MKVKNKFYGLLVIVLVLFVAGPLRAQCPNDNPGPTCGPFNGGTLSVGVRTHVCTLWAGESQTVTNLVAGNTYRVDFCGILSDPAPSYNSLLTVYGPTGLLVGFNDNFCGDDPQFDFVAPLTGTYNILADISGNCNGSNTTNTPLAITLMATGCSNPTITTQPANRSVCNFGNTTFTIATTGATSWQWQVNTGSGFVNLSNVAPHSGVTTQTLTITGATVGMSGYLYRCIASNAPCNTTSNQATLTVSNPALTANMQTNVSCFGGSNGAASVNAASGGIAPYTYNWTPGNPTGDGTVSITGLTATTWTCTTTDNIGCAATATFNITQPTAIVLNANSQTNVSCFGGSNGAASVVAATGGAGGYTYNWTPGNPTGDGTTSVTGLTAGSWTCTVTDANSCQATRTFNITAPTALVVTPASQTNVSNYGGNNGAASINTPTGGAGGYTYNWTPGNPTGDGTTSVTGLTAGSWTCTVTDANGCNATQTFLITQPGAALNFDGANDFVSVPASPALNALGAGFTLEAWVNPSNVAPAISIIRKTGDYNMYIAGGTLRAEVWPISGNPTVNFYTGTTAIVPGVWTHVAIVWNGTTCVQYVNGVLDPNSVTTGSIGGSENMFIGISSLFGNPFVGSMDEVRVWNRALCQSEIQNNRTCEIATTGTGLVTNYHFNHGTAGGNNAGITTLVDATGNGNSGTLSNFTLNGASSNWIGPGGVTSGVSCGAFVPPVVTVTAVSQTNISCFGGSNGAASVSASGGSGFSYNWTPGNPTGDGTASVTGLTAGTWTCSVTNNCGGVGTRTFNITQPTAPVSGTTVVTNVSCFGGSNGAINLTPTGGTGPYTFNWLPSGPTTEDRTGLTAGTYSVQITDVNGCVGTVTATVTQPTSPVSGTTVVTNVACFGGSNGAINLTPTGGTGPYTFNWLPSGPTTEDRTGLVAGTYTVQITDVNGCVGTVTATVTQPTSPVSGTTVVTNVACFGGSNGAINLTPTGGTGPYTFNWLPSGPTTEDRTGLIAGTYSVQITDVNGCVGTVTATVTQPTSPVSGTTVVTNVACFGGSNGAINLTPTGGTGPYTFNWLPSGPTTEDRTGLVAGTYSVQITDVNGCVGTVTATVTQPTSPVSGTTIVTNVACFGGSNGAINLTPTGGTGPYTFNWLPSGPTTEDRTGLVAGTYTVQITDVNGCVGTRTATVTQPTSPVSGTTVVTNVSCFGGSNGAINLTPTGGTGPYTFNWLPSGPTTEDRTGLVAGTYSVQILDNNGCAGTVTATVISPSALVASAASQTNISCFGGSNGAASVTVSGGTTAYSYNWTPGNPTGDGTASVTGLTAGTWTCTVTDANSCVTTQTFNITAPSALVASAASQTNISCFGGSNGAASVTVSGGTTAYSYNWTPGNPTGDGTASVTSLTAGTWTCTVTDANSCVTTQTFNITSPSAITAVATQTNVSCNGGTNGSASVAVSGGAPGYTYAWMPSGGNAATASGLAAGTYTVTITDANSCLSTQTFNITAPIALSVSSSVTNVSCNGGADGSANVVVMGGVAPFTYAWTPSGGTLATASGLTPGVYTCNITDNNGCAISQSVTITEPTPLAVTESSTDITCFGANNGSADVVVTGGTGPYTYVWSPSGGNTASATGLSPSLYSCTITDANGCTYTSTFVINEPSVLTASASATSIACNGGTAVVTVTESGGTAPFTGGGTFTVTAGTYSYTITDANGCTTTTSVTVTEPTALAASSSATTITCNGGNATVTVAATGGTAPYTGAGTFTQVAGTYTYTVTDANGCTTTTSVTITEPTALAASSSATSIACFGGNSTVTVAATGGTAPYTGDGTFTEVAGTYSYTVTDANGCTTTTSITVTEPAPFSPSSIETNITCFGGNDGAIDITVTGGTMPYTYDWNSGTYTTEDLTGLTAGTYSILLTDANGCTLSGTMAVAQPSAIAHNGVVTDATGCTTNDGMIDLTTLGGTGAFTFAWSNAATTEDISGLDGGVYSVIITDSNNCTASATFTVAEPGAPTVTYSETLDTVCVADGPFLLSGESPVGGTFAGPGVSAGMFDPFTAGVGTHTISYTYTDVGGCTGSTVDSIYVDICLDANTQVVSSTFTVYPNPNNGTFTLQLNNNSVADVMIYDVQGKLVSTQKVNSNNSQITIAESGMYMITVINADGNQSSQRVIVTE